MVSKLRRLATKMPPCKRLVAGKMTVAMLCCLGPAAVLLAQQPDVHYEHRGVMPPGAIGSRQLQRGGPLPGFFQPVEIKAPAGALVSMASAERFGPRQPSPQRVGLLIGSVYRLRVTNIATPEGTEGLEVFPTIEVIDRLYAPPGQEFRFAIPIELSTEDLKLALAGKFVTRVIYLEDPHQAAPVREINHSQNWFEVAVGQDPLAAADTLGRPVAILRLGGRLPDAGADAGFFFGSPPYVPAPPMPAMATAKAPPRAEVVPPGKKSPPLAPPSGPKSPSAPPPPLAPLPPLPGNAPEQPQP
jgi:hypothetical protein